MVRHFIPGGLAESDLLRQSVVAFARVEIQTAQSLDRA